MSPATINPLEFGLVGLVLVILLAVVNNVLRVWSEDLRERRKMERYREEMKTPGKKKGSGEIPYDGTPDVPSRSTTLLPRLRVLADVEVDERRSSLR